MKILYSGFQKKITTSFCFRMSAKQVIEDVVVFDNSLLRSVLEERKEEQVNSVLWSEGSHPSIESLGGEIIIPDGLQIDDVFSFIGAEVRLPAYNIKMRVASIVEQSFVISLSTLTRTNRLPHFKALLKNPELSEKERNFLEREVIDSATKDVAFTGLVYKPVKECLERLERLQKESLN